MRIALILVGVGLVACAPNERAFPKQFATSSCKAQMSCDESYFNSTWDTLSECVQELEDNVGPYPNCSYDRKQAAECLGAVRKYTRTCDDSDFNNQSRDCAIVWNCGYYGYYGYYGRYDTSR